MIESCFNLATYHWAWYIFGFLFAPRVTLCVLLMVYLLIPVYAKASLLVALIGYTFMLRIAAMAAKK